MTGVTTLRLGDYFRRPCSNDQTTTTSALRTQVDDPIGSLNDIKAVFNYQNRISLINETRQNRQKSTNIFKMQTCSWLIQQVDRMTRTAFG